MRRYESSCAPYANRSLEKPARSTHLLAVIATCFLLSLDAHGQNNEIAITTGGALASTAGFNVSPTWAVGGSLTHRLFQSSGPELRRTAIYLELPVLGAKGNTQRAPLSCVPGPEINCRIPVDPPLTTVEYASVFFTPGIKVKFAVQRFAPYIVTGGGIGFFSAAGSETRRHPALSYGAGADFGLTKRFALRGEVRDFNSAAPFATGRQNSVLTTGGVVFRF